MVYDTQNYWVFGLFSIVWYSREHDVSHSKDPRCLLPHLHLRTETDPVSETSCSLEYQAMENA
jgi:hypothetical protein